MEEPIPSLPGVNRLSLDRLLPAAEQAHKLGIPAICLFPYTDPSLRTETCEEAWNPENLTNRAIRALKAELPDLMVMTDIALDPYNANGHDGFVVDGEIVNDETVAALVKMGLAQADAGADILGPSDMMDGRIGRFAQRAGRRGTAMWRSCPMRRNLPPAFTARSAMRWAPLAGWWGTRPPIRSTPPMRAEALACVARDLAEGADMVMVKPGMPYLDICRAVKDRFQRPTFAYQVSGEYAMIMAAVQNGWLNEEKVMLESLMAFKRAGCDGVLTYFAPKVAAALKG
jgi:porphobilinogen synthase